MDREIDYELDAAVDAEEFEERVQDEVDRRSAAVCDQGVCYMADTIRQIQTVVADSYHLTALLTPELKLRIIKKLIGDYDL